MATLVIGFEDGHDLHLRLAAMRDAMGLADSDGVLLSTEPVVTAMSDASVEMFFAEEVATAKLKADELEIRLGAVVLDTGRHLVRGSTLNDDAATSRITGLLYRLAAELDCVAEVISHTPLSDEGRESGSAEQKGGRSYQWRVNGGTIHMAKSRFGRDGFDIGYYRIEDGSLPLDYPVAADAHAPGVLMEVDAGEIIADFVKRQFCSGFKEFDELEFTDERDKPREKVERDFTTAVYVLGLCRQPRDNSQDRSRIGWSQSKLVAALKDVKGLPNEPEVHIKSTYVRSVNAAMERAGLLVNMHETRENGAHQDWRTTKKGADLYRAVIAQREEGQRRGQSEQPETTAEEPK